MFEKYVQTGLIEPEELHELINNDIQNLIILDASFALPTSGIDTYKEFQKSHLKGAQFFDIEKIADKNTDLPHMLPSKEEFAGAMNELGISNKVFVVVYGQDGIVMGAARAWWMFKAMGHKNVAILNGGLPAWIKSGFNTSNKLSPIPLGGDNYKPEPNPQLICNLKMVQNHSAQKSALIFDARPAERFFGKVEEPRANLKTGHIPNSHNIPAKTLIDPETLKLKSRSELEQLFKPYNLSHNDTIITTCGSGVTACIISFALYHIGINNAVVYDGSWAEWAIPQLNNSISQ